MAEILVQKYGGSSLSDLDRIKRVAEKIVATKEKGYDLVVVVSAMGDTTDNLLEMAKELSPNPSRRELDMLLSVGERISMALMSIAIQAYGHEAVSLTGSQCGIITTHSHSNARIMDVRPFRVQDELAMGRIVIVAGYQGASYRRDVTTLGRGGSDTTAVALAGALGATACEIYSDVDGVYSADPRVILTARQLEELSFDEMQEMARSGAKVLNEEAVEFARRAKIALYARSTYEVESKGTVVRVDRSPEELVRAERACPAVAVSHISRGLLLAMEGEWEELAERIAELPMASLELSRSQGLRGFLGLENIHGLEAFRKSLQVDFPGLVAQEQGFVSVVGCGMGRRPIWALEGERLLREEGLSSTHLFVHPDRLSWVVPLDQVSKAAVALHRHFLES